MSNARRRFMHIIVVLASLEFVLGTLFVFTTFSGKDLCGGGILNFCFMPYLLLLACASVIKLIIAIGMSFSKKFVFTNTLGIIMSVVVWALIIYSGEIIYLAPHFFLRNPTIFSVSASVPVVTPFIGFLVFFRRQFRQYLHMPSIHV